ncbi:MAG: aldo/keto reductase [Bacillus subtilis]|nr:aldo/keto reductase [Bacillus subtilis]
MIQAYGVSIDTKEELASVLKRNDIDVVELLFNVFFQAPRDLFEEVKAKKIFLVCKVPLDSGWLTGKYDAQSVFAGIRARWSRADIERRAEPRPRAEDDPRQGGPRAPTPSPSCFPTTPCPASSPASRRTAR